MFKKLNFILIVGIIATVLLLTACGEDVNREAEVSEDQAEDAVETVSAEEEAPEVIGSHEDLNQEPVPLEVERDGSDVYVKMTAQITDIEIEEGYNYKAWTFNGEAPGPLVEVNEGDTIHFTLDNLDPAIPHSMDFHAVHTAPDKGFADVAPNEEGRFSYKADNPGVFMYHCGTDPVLSHIANGMHGVIIVHPDDGYPTDDEVDEEYVIIQNEWYRYNDLDDMTNNEPSQVVFSTKALEEGQANTNGVIGALQDEPLEANVGDKVRFYVNNVGPNEVSSFHVIGTLFDDVYLDGNPANHLEGMQTVMLPTSGGAVVEFTVTEEGEYPFVTHQFKHATKGAMGVINVTE
ncbi:nitrite reductase (NO-forming) [Virgibacillus natechei]|uniref:Copper-containing nitrite reductase n=1 Tax=Virgibacillus natechei TaxID=1216297 RepID=A0ABS4IER7_9BACI|nr:multicopper oxidase domain-containing protein [Virgibacillus natechei]MBP1969390.1 nitrite reductase (NO-forming) [Virgibacillus natechei]UZD11894.1 multicopper oxidase domain-containing protein [Virgibacillus natechei]